MTLLASTLQFGFFGELLRVDRVIRAAMWTFNSHVSEPLTLHANTKFSGRRDVRVNVINSGNTRESRAVTSCRGSFVKKEMDYVCDASKKLEFIALRLRRFLRNL